MECVIIDHLAYSTCTWQFFSFFFFSPNPWWWQLSRPLSEIRNHKQPGWPSWRWKWGGRCHGKQQRRSIQLRIWTLSHPASHSAPRLSKCHAAREKTKSWSASTTTALNGEHCGRFCSQRELGMIPEDLGWALSPGNLMALPQGDTVGCQSSTLDPSTDHRSDVYTCCFDIWSSVYWGELSLLGSNHCRHILGLLPWAIKPVLII